MTGGQRSSKYRRERNQLREENVRLKAQNLSLAKALERCQNQTMGGGE